MAVKRTYDSFIEGIPSPPSSTPVAKLPRPSSSGDETDRAMMLFRYGQQQPAATKQQQQQPTSGSSAAANQQHSNTGPCPSTWRSAHRAQSYSWPVPTFSPVGAADACAQSAQAASSHAAAVAASSASRAQCRTTPAMTSRRSALTATKHKCTFSLSSFLDSQKPKK
ncbi:hypothetical protein DL89DRAFT_308493 [Linderina pennispora]|uniref:Uncharacterized protein n=1 Tax=Linderina pennispora TaxID=61395 RepID=A0A1Y1WHQ6_9FUNG|nr:uncharacterized protein DL89DRAFT_308493 [Linderina pennispora]ORX72766.1 hypothetical protein DL89DRAFT_308493 [Linderina pennispora]